MNKKILALLVAALMLLASACNKVDDPNGVNMEATDTQLGPGVAENEFSDDPFAETSESVSMNEATDPIGATEIPTESTMEPTQDATDPTEIVTEPTEESTYPTDEVTEPTEEPTEPEGNGDQTALSPNAAAYAAYIAMTGEEQTAFINTFESPIAFLEWLAIAEAEYKAQNPGVDVGDGNIDFGGGN